jgi:hypothetical protein
MYRFILVILIFVLLAPFSTLATTDDDGWNEYTIRAEDFEHPDAPKFEQYIIPIKFSGEPAPVNLGSHPEARTWRTKLKEGNEKGPNFADHMTIATWGCGTDCTSIAFIDARNGQVYFADNLRSNVSVNIHDKVFGKTLSFRRDSNLLIVAGCPNEECSTRRGVIYFIWTGKNIKELFRVPRGWYPEK